MAEYIGAFRNPLYHHVSTKMLKRIDDFQAADPGNRPAKPDEMVSIQFCSSEVVNDAGEWFSGDLGGDQVLIGFNFRNSKASGAKPYIKNILDFSRG